MVTVDQHPQSTDAAREQLGFLRAAHDRFGFLVELGFEEVGSDATHLRFERGDRFVEVFHGRASYELGVEFGRSVRVHNDVIEQKFHVADVLSTLAPDLTFTARTATSREQVDRFVEELARASKVAAELLEYEGVDAFDRISGTVERRSDEYLEGLRAIRLRARAEEAWHRKDFPSVVAAYEEIESELPTVGLRGSETKRLHYARKHLGA